MADWEMITHRLDQIETRLATIGTRARRGELASLLSTLRDEVTAAEDTTYAIELDPAPPNKLRPWRVTMPGMASWHAESQYDAVRQLRVQMEKKEYAEDLERGEEAARGVPFDVDITPVAAGPEWEWPDTADH